MTGTGGERVTIRLILADRGVRTVILVAFVMMFGAGLVLPILPLFARSFGVGYGGAGVLVSVYALARLATDLASGFVVHRVGERRAGIGGLMLLGVGALATGLAPGYWVAVATWGLAGVGSAVVFAALYSQLLKLVPAHRLARTLSVFYGSFNVAIVAGGFLAGVIAHVLGVAAPLFFTAATALLGALLYLLFVPHARENAGEAPVTRLGVGEISRVVRTSGFLMVNVTNLAYLWMIAAVVDTLVPLFARDALGMSTIGIGIVLAVAPGCRVRRALPRGQPRRSKGPPLRHGARARSPGRDDRRRRVERDRRRPRPASRPARDRFRLRGSPAGRDARGRRAARRLRPRGRRLSLLGRPRLHARPARRRLRRRGLRLPRERSR